MIMAACLVVTGIASAQDPGLPDSLIVSSLHAESLSTFQTVNIPIYCVTDDSVTFYCLPLKWWAPLGGISANARAAQYFFPLTSWDEHYDTALIAQSYILQIGWADLMADTTPDPPMITNGQRFHAWTLRYVIAPNPRSQLVVLDTCWDTRNGGLAFGLIDGLTQIMPGFQRGFISIGAVGAEEPAPTPMAYSLKQNYPNPFNPETNIEFALPKEDQVSLVVFNLLGQQIRTLVDSKLPPGVHSVHWDGRNDQGAEVPSGVYFYRMYTPGFSQTNKMTMLR
jgi:hypothetical protein